ncbi:MAG: hypothetical protein LBM67_03230 [Lentimicrobiaceae bacterium]|jgi:hypothetical protein|nr:hypothetical protein [Lentimicrobiaceae bacterium]
MNQNKLTGKINFGTQKATTINQLEFFLDSCFETLGVNESSEGIITSCAVEFCNLLSQLGQRESIAVDIQVQHEGLTLTFLLNEEMYFAVKEFIINNSTDERTVKIVLLSETIEFDEVNSAIDLLFETKSVFGETVKSRNQLLSKYHQKESFKVKISYDSNSRS